MKFFITFSTSDNRYMDGALRLIKTVKKNNIFDNIKIITDKDLKDDKTFWNEHGEFIEKNKHKGYGYWLWKPYIIKTYLDKLNNDDILFYLDCDCLLKNNKYLIETFFKRIKKDLIIGALVPYPNEIEKNWTKKDLINYLELFDDKYINTNQRQGGTNMFLVCDKVKNLVNEWYKISCNYKLLDDTLILDNIDTFKAHRHDQSIFSLLTKKYNIYSDYSLNDIIDITYL